MYHSSNIEYLIIYHSVHEHVFIFIIFFFKIYVHIHVYIVDLEYLYFMNTEFCEIRDKISIKFNKVILTRLKFKHVHNCNSFHYNENLHVHSKNELA